MKSTEIALIVLIATISIAASYFIGNALLGDPNDRVENLSYIEPISGDIKMPDAEDFNASAVNPTVEVYVGNCGPMEVWDAAAKVCRSKYEDTEEETNETPSEDNNSSDESRVTPEGLPSEDPGDNTGE